MDLAYTSAAELAGLIRGRAVSPVEVMRATLDRIERSQPVLNAFITIAADAAMDAARAAEAAVMRGAALGPLHGVPVAVKDLIPTANIRTTWGSLIFKDHIPEHDAVAVARLKQAGAIVVGKTTTPEFGQQCLTQAPLFGRTRNAWRADRSSGGSSGGSAVAVAAGLVPIAVATDGGGSTRIPAACNGVVGFKQGLGVVPQEYAQDGFGNISYITPMTRTVLDTALMLDAMAGTDLRDPLTTGRPKADFVAAARGGDLKELAHRVARAARQRRGGDRCADKLRGCTGHIRRAWCGGVRIDGTVREPRGGVVRQQRRLSHGAVWPSPEAASRHHVPDLRAADGSGGELLGGRAVRRDLPAHAALSAGAGVVRHLRHRRDADAVAQRGADRSGLLRADRDRQPVGREHPRVLVSRTPCRST